MGARGRDRLISGFLEVFGGTALGGILPIPDPSLATLPSPVARETPGEALRV